RPCRRACGGRPPAARGPDRRAPWQPRRGGRRRRDRRRGRRSPRSRRRPPGASASGPARGRSACIYIYLLKRHLSILRVAVVDPAPLPRRLLAEFLGSAFLAATVVGSGIAAAQLSPGDTGLPLLENATATAAGLFTFILVFGPISGAHLN